MDKLYSKQKDSCLDMKPKQETINFLLHYSKSVKVMRTEKKIYKIHLN